MPLALGEKVGTEPPAPAALRELKEQSVASMTLLWVIEAVAAATSLGEDEFRSVEVDTLTRQVIGCAFYQFAGGETPLAGLLIAIVAAGAVPSAFAVSTSRVDVST
jgi:hypothetical protein